MSKPLNVLIVEDSQDDAELTMTELQLAGFAPKWKRVDTEAAFLAELKHLPDIIFSDYSLPRFSGMKALSLVRESGLEIPFILISGTVSDQAAVAAMKLGATDFLLKDSMERLGQAVEDALKVKNRREERQRADAELQSRLRELKREVNELLARQNLPPRYPEVDQEIV